MDEFTHLQVLYEMELDREHIHRTVYSFLGLLGDVGGLTTSLITCLQFLVLICIYNYQKYKYATLLYSRKEL